MDATQLCRFSDVPDGGARVVDEACIGRPVVVVRRGAVLRFHGVRDAVLLLDHVQDAADAERLRR